VHQRQDFLRLQVPRQVPRGQHLLLQRPGARVSIGDRVRSDILTRAKLSPEEIDVAMTRIGKRRAEENMARLNEGYWLKRRREREAIVQALRLLETRPTSGYSIADVDAQAWAAAEVLKAALMTDEQYHDAQQDAASL
jgi:hypothetical protein